MPINTHGRFRWGLTGLAVGLIMIVLAACQTVPISGRSQLLLVSEADEVQLGVQSYQEILRQSKVSTDQKVLKMVRRVGMRIATATGRTDLKWEFTVIKDDQVNAFALPGGKVAVYTGLLPVTRDETGLAVVLGHEVAHAVARHGAERLTQELVVKTGLEATKSALSNRDPDTVKTVSALLGAGATYGLILPWSRAQESEADRLGLVYMAKAGYDPRAARDLWTRMAGVSKGQGRPSEFLSTHPSEATRIRQITEWLPEALQYYKPRR